MYKLFLNGETKPLDYTGDKSESDLKRFLSEHTSKRELDSEGWDVRFSLVDLWFGLPGTLEVLDRVAGEFFQAASGKEETNVNALLDKAREQVKEFVDVKEQKRWEEFFLVTEQRHDICLSSAQSYLKIMELVVKNGVEFLKREQRRVENLLKGKVRAIERETSFSQTRWWFSPC